MSLSDEERKIMVGLEIERAHRLIEQFPILEDAKLWDTLANRVYYAVFHAVTALLIISKAKELVSIIEGLLN